MTLLEAIKDDFEAAGWGTLGEDIFFNIMPDEPDECIVIIDNGGYAPDEVRRPTIQFVIRSESYSVAKEKAELIFRRYHDKEWYSIGEHEIVQSNAVDEPEWIGQDKDKRDEISLNIVFMRGDY